MTTKEVTTRVRSGIKEVKTLTPPTISALRWKPTQQRWLQACLTCKSLREVADLVKMSYPGIRVARYRDHALRDAMDYYLGLGIEDRIQVAREINALNVPLAVQRRRDILDTTPQAIMDSGVAVDRRLGVLSAQVSDTLKGAGVDRQRHDIAFANITTIQDLEAMADDDEG